MTAGYILTISMFFLAQKVNESHLVNIKLALASRQLPVAGGKLANKIVTKEQNSHQSNKYN